MKNGDLLKKIKENECYLIGQIPLDNYEIDIIMNYAKNIINLEDKYIIDGPDLILSTALVQIAINEYQDGKYWEAVKHKFDMENISAQKQGILGKIFINTLKEYNLFELKQNSSGSMRYVENIKAHAFVTNNYMEGFYDFLYDYYENNLFRDISNGVEETLQDLSDYIKTTMNQNTDTIYSSNNGRTKKSYKLLKSTREVIAQLTGNVLYQLFYPSLKIIDQNFYDGILPQNKNSDRFARVFCEWYSNKEKKNENKSREKCERRFYSPKPYVVLNTNAYIKSPFTLVIPKRKYRATECDGNVYVTITINGIARHPKQLEVSRNMGTYISEEYRLPISYPFDEIKIEIDSLENNEIIIENKEYVIFNEKCIKTSRFEKGINYLLVKPGAKVEFSDEKILIEQEKFDEWIQYKVNISEDSICYMNTKPLTIIGEFSKEPIFEHKINFFNTYNENGSEIIATRFHPLISFELARNSLPRTTIQINNKNYLLNKFLNNNITIYNSPIDQNQLIISVDLNDIIEEENNGYYRVELNIPGENNKFITEYLLLSNVFFIFDKTRYINEEEAKLTLKTNGMNIEILDDNCKMIYSNEYRNSYYYILKLNSEHEMLNAKLILDMYNFFIRVPIKMMLCGFSEDNLQYKIEKEIWYSKLQQLLYIKFPFTKKIGIYSNVDFSKIIWGEEIKEGLFRINITQLIQDIKESRNQYQYLYIKYEDTREKYITLYKVIKNIKIDPYFEFEYYNDIPCFNVEFKEIPGVKIYYSIMNENEQYSKIIDHRELKNGINYLPEIERDIYYKIVPTIEETDEYGLNTAITTLPVRKHKGIISFYYSKSNSNIYDFEIIGKKFEITKLLYNNEELLLNSIYSYMIEIFKKNFDETYSGKMYEYDTESTTTNKRRLIGNIKIVDLQRDNEDDFSFWLESYSDSENEWYELYYYKEKSQIVENDNSILDEVTFEKVIGLEKNNTKYIVKIIRRRS